MNELIFIVEEAPEGGYTARALGESIFTEADDLTQLQEQVRDAVLCHFDEDEARPKLIRLHFVREELIAGLSTSDGHASRSRNGSSVSSSTGFPI